MICIGWLGITIRGNLAMGKIISISKDKIKLADPLIFSSLRSKNMLAKISDEGVNQLFVKRLVK